MLNSKEKNRLREVFQTFPEIQAVFLFGSAASGKRNKLSDLDLGVFTSNPFFRKKKLDLLQKLTEKGFDNVDVVLLDEADIIYIKLSDNLVAESDEDKSGIIIDYDEEGNVAGMEILNASKRIPDPFHVGNESSG